MVAPAQAVQKWLDKTREVLEEQATGGALPEEFHRLEGAVAELLRENAPPQVNRIVEWEGALRAIANQNRKAAVKLAGEAKTGPPDDLAAVWCMLLQMAFEKYAKAVIARTDAQAFPKCLRTHKVLTRFFNILASRTDFTGIWAFRGPSSGRPRSMPKPLKGRILRL